MIEIRNGTIATKKIILAISSDAPAAARSYRLRKQIVAPVFGQIKHARGFRQFLLRSLDKVRGERAMICTAHNLLKLAKATG